MDNLLKLVWILGKNISSSLPIRQLASDAKVPYATAYRTIAKYKSVFAVVKKGNIRLCSLNLEDSITKNYLILAERQQSELFLSRHPELSVLRKELPAGDYSCILFGSRAEEKERKKSDMDICIINKDGSKNVNFSKYELVFKTDINPIYLARMEFRQMLREKSHNLSREIIQKHIILYGEEYFWNIVFKDGI
jgi:predicted nucleotidyltransferase